MNLRSFFGFVVLGISVISVVLFFVFSTEFYNLDSSILRIGLILGWTANNFLALFFLRHRSEKIRDKGFLVAKNGESRVWDRIPISVYFLSSVGSGWRRAVNDAVADINATVGYQLFFTPQDAILEMQNETAIPGVVKVVEDGSDPNHGSTTFWPENPPTRSAIVRLPRREELHELTRFEVALHEFGHVLGLDHDDDTESVMDPKIDNRPGRLTERDVRLLRVTYGALERPKRFSGGSE